MIVRDQHVRLQICVSEQLRTENNNRNAGTYGLHVAMDNLCRVQVLKGFGSLRKL